MKKLMFGLFVAILSVTLFACKNSKNTAEVEEREGGIQIDPELKELGELNALLLQYDDAGDKLGDCIAVKSNKKWGLINIKGDTIIDFKYDKIERLLYAEYWNLKVKNVEASNNNDRYDVGIADAKGKIIIKPIKEIQSCEPLVDGVYVAYDFRVEPHLYNGKGEEIILCYDADGYDFPLRDIKKINDKFFMVYSGYAWFRTTYDKSAKPEFKIDDVGYSDAKASREMCFVKNEEDIWGAINGAGETVVPFVYSNVKMLGNESVFVQNEEGKWGMLIGKGVNAYYDNFMKSIDDYSIGKDGATYVVLDKQGKELFRNKDLNDYSFYSDGMFMGRHRLYDSKGNTIVTLSDSLSVDDYLNNYIVVQNNNGYYGIVDKKGTCIVPATYEMGIRKEKDLQLFLLTRCVKDEEVNGKREVVLESDIFNTKNGKLIKTSFSIDKFKGKYALVEINGRHLYINEEGKTGILNLEEVLTSLNEKAQQSKQKENQEEQSKLEENIKKQLVKLVNDHEGWEVLSSPSSLYDFHKEENGMYKANYNIRTNEETVYYELRNIEVDKNGKVVGLENKAINVKPKDTKPDGGIVGVDEMVDKITGRKRY